jgi:hypothetical protein
MKKILFPILSLMLAFISPISSAQVVPTVVLNYSTNGSVSPVTPTLTWSTANAVSCTATSNPSDSLWSGPLGTSGSVTVSPIKVATTYNINCVSASDTTATLSWTAPTLNTDGTALTDLAGFRAYEVINGTGVLVSDMNQPNYVSLPIINLSVGTHTFYVTAYNTSLVESSPSSQGSKTIVGSASTVQSVTVPVSKKPAPPQTLTVK